VIMDAFHAEKDRAKAEIAKAAKAKASPPLIPVDALLMAEMMAYYQEYNPAFANQKKVEAIAKVFQTKATKAGNIEGWKEMLYAALAGKPGCEDPREVYARGSQSAAATEPEPELAK
jgi:hypothetical protein